MEQFDQPSKKGIQNDTSGRKEACGQHVEVHDNNRRRCRNGLYEFHAESKYDVSWSALKNNPMAGITFPRLVRLLFLKEKERFQLLTSNTHSNPHQNVTTSISKYPKDASPNYGNGIDWWIYPHRIAALLMISLLNWALEIIEWLYIRVLLRKIMDVAKNDHQVRANFRRMNFLRLAFFSRLISRLRLRILCAHQPPVFIIGHPRTGTTLMHSLLALDEERFCVCNTFAAGFPTGKLSRYLIFPAASQS
jgi:hypothetical protein